MAEIPVEKKSSLSWLWWLLLALGILAAIWWLIAATGDDNPEGARYDGDANPGYTEESLAETDTGGVMALTGIAGLASLGDMIGREVELTDVAVNQVVSDMGFTVGEGANETLVMFDEERTPGTAMEGGVDVNPGSNVTIMGEVRAFPGDLPVSVTEEVETDATAMIFARSVETVQ